MKIALAQLNSTPGSFAATVERMLSAAHDAAAQGADLVVFPSTLLSGAYPTGISESHAFGLDMLAAIEDYARRTPVRSVVPAYVFDGTCGYTEVFLCEEGLAGPLRMREVGDSDAGPETAGAHARIGGVSINFVVGESVAYGEDLDADLTCIFSSLPYCDQDSSTLLAAGLADGALRGLVQECPSWVAVVQGVGGYDDAILAGGSFAVDPEERLVASCPSFDEGLCVFDVQPIPSSDEVIDGIADEPARGARTTDAGVPLDEIPSLTADQRTGFLWEALTLAVRDYVQKCGFSQVVIGLSGGIDSTVVATLAVDALGAQNVLGVLMPGPYSSESSITDAAELAANLGIETRTVPIKTMFDAACALYADALGGAFGGVARENLQARLRGCTLMSLANSLNALVLNTGNKSEAGMGYSTLYGDTVGAFAPLSDLYKGRVYDLARWRNGRSQVAPIPANVLVKPPSAELSEGQTDEGSFGVSYAQLDAILSMHVERGASADEIIAATGADAETVAHVLLACQRAEFKRRQEPMGPIVSMAAFIDRGWPVVLGWRDVPGVRESTAPDLAEDDDEAAELALEGDVNPVGLKIAEMLGNFLQQDRIVGTVGDMAFGAVISGRGVEMDSVMGMPLFSKN